MRSSPPLNLRALGCAGLWGGGDAELVVAATPLRSRRLAKQQQPRALHSTDVPSITSAPATSLRAPRHVALLHSSRAAVSCSRGLFFPPSPQSGVGSRQLHAAPAAGHDLCSGDVVVAMRKDGCFPRGGSEGCKRDKLLREEASAPWSHPGPCTPCLGFPIRQAGGCLSASCQSIPGNWVEKSAVGDCRFGRCPHPFSGRQG